MAIKNASKARNPANYVIISNPTAGVEVACDLPDRFSLAVSSQFEPVDFSLQTVGRGAATAANIIGGNILAKEATKLIWLGTTPMEFTLPLIFDAETSSYEDVHQVYCNLQMLVLPDGGRGFLFPPNTTRFSNNNKTTVWIGKQFWFDSVVITTANITSESRLNAGYPIAGQIDMTFQTEYVYSRADYVKAAGIGTPRGIYVPRVPARTPFARR
jgi:hypothetical protein